MKCKSCMADIPDGSNFCNVCGVSQIIQTAKQKKPKARGNGQGTVYKVGSTWAAEVTLGYYMTDEGKRKRKNRRKYGFPTKKAALAYIETLRAAKPKKEINFADLYAIFERSTMQKLSLSKVQAYRKAWNRISASICFWNISEVAVPELQHVTDDCGISFYTKKDIKILLSHLYKIAIRDDYIDRNKAQYIELPELETEERTTFSEPEIAALWKDAEQYIVQHLLVMLYTGMRPAELLSIQTENIFVPDHYMTGGVKTKKSKARKIIIPDKITDAICRLIAAAKGEKLSNYSKNQFYAAWNSYKASRGLRSELSPYCCRHTYVTRLTALKVSPAMLKELVGHEDYETTLEYTHLSVADRLTEVNRLE